MSDRANLAAIDIGTSSVHLAIARPVEGTKPEILLREKLPVRLGSGATDMKALDPDAVNRALDALKNFGALADAHQADIHAVATSAVREAEDADAFIERAWLEAGIDIAVISGAEEARLIHLGVLGAVPLARSKHLVIDIGGGSTEFIVSHDVEPLLLRSLKIGHVRTANRFFPDGLITPEAVDQCRIFLLSFLARIKNEVTELGFDRVVGCSGTFETMAEVARNLRESGTSDSSGAVSRREIDAALSLVLSAKTPPEREKISGVDPHRADTIIAGALIVEAIMTTFAVDEFTVSPDALREGLVLDRLGSHDSAESGLHHLTTIRASSVRSVVERYGESIADALVSTDFSLHIFDALMGETGFGDFERDVLEAAAMLHNVGRHVGHSAHHRHSYYLIRNTDHLAGFHEHERKLIALVARYHRKSAPKPSHAPFNSLGGQDQHLVRVLAGILRIGIALDRTAQRAVSRIDVELKANSVVLTVHGQQMDLELFSADQRKGLLESSLRMPIFLRKAN